MPPVKLVIEAELDGLIRLFHCFSEVGVFLYCLSNLCFVLLVELVILFVAVLVQSHSLHQLLSVISEDFLRPFQRLVTFDLEAGYR